MERLYCRCFQKVIKAGMYVLPWKMPRMLEGPGQVKELPKVIRKTHCRKALVVTGKNIRKLGLLDGFLKAMDQEGMPYALFDQVEPNPTDFLVEAGVRVFLKEGCDCIVAFGGGSPMDCAKAIGARIARPRKSVSQMQGLFRVLRPIPAVFAVPTTAGTGSETTIAAVVTEAAAHHKASMTDLCLMPRFAVLDPELTVGLPRKVTAATGMDALCHAVEAYTNDIYNSRLERELARKAVKLIYDNLYHVYQDGSDLKARQNLQKAAFYAGRAFTRGSVGYVHAIGHPLSGLYGTPHGLAMAILLPHVMRAYGSAAHEKLAELCDLCGIRPQAATREAKAEAFIGWMEEMKERMEIPVYPPVLREEDLDRIVDWAHKEGNPLYPTPVTWRKKEFRYFLNGMMRSRDLPAETDA